MPYLTFSLFHVATYANKTLIPKLFPPSLQSLSPPLKTFVEKYQAPALQAIAYYEVVVIPAALLIGLIPRWVRLFTPILFGQFLLQRYHGSNTTKRAFRTARLQADKLLLGPSIPEPAKKAYIQARDFLERLGGGIRTAETPGTGPQPQAAPQPQPAPEGPLAEEKVSEKKSE